MSFDIQALGRKTLNTIKSTDPREFGKNSLKALGKQKAVAAIALMMVLMFFSESRFYSSLNLINILQGAAPELIIAFGVTLAVICRGCDLSVGAVMSLSGILAVQWINDGMNIYQAMLYATLSGTIVGFVNGFLIVHQKTEAFIITLGMGMLVKGIALFLTNGNPVPARSMEFMMVSNGSLLKDYLGITFFGVAIPNIIVYMIILGVFTFWLLRHTSFGRNCYALGGDYEVAEHSGINVIRAKWVAFIITGTYAAFAGVLMASRMNTGSAIYGDLTPLIVNCGVVIGGTSFAGGIGGVPHSFIGIMVMQTLKNCMSSFRIGGIGGFEMGKYKFHQDLILGVVIVAIIAMDCYAIKRKKEDV